MEIGGIDELSVLTPGERFWIDKAVAAAGGGDGKSHAEAVMARAGKRELRCRGTGDEPADCPEQVTHYTLQDDGSRLRCYCLRHWTEAGGTRLFGGDDAGTSGAPEDAQC